MEFNIIHLLQWVLCAIVIPLVVGWYNLKERVTVLEGRVETNEKGIENVHSDRKDLGVEMKEMKDLLQQVLIKLTALETRQQMRDENKNKS